MADLPSERDPLDQLAEEFADRCRRGETPSVSEYTTRYPEWADQLRDLLPPVALMEQLRRHKQTARAVAADTKLERLGDFRILREVGRGGMGIVYEAVQESLGRHVALKVLPRHALLDPKKLQRFQREAQAAARLHHTNIVPVFGVGEHEGLHYYVMQLIAGQGLDEVLERFRQDKPPDDHAKWVARIGVQATEALDNAHRQGTLHRDVKPANLLLDEAGTLWVTDFGLAKGTASSAGPDRLTNTGDILGTWQYMAPECFEGQADARSDIYSLGLTLYELLTLEPPFGESDPASLIRQVTQREPVRPRKLNPAIPRDLETVILKAIARERRHRYQAAAELAEDLKRFLEDRPIRARRATAAERLGRWCRRNPVMAGLSLLAVASLILAAVMGWVNSINNTRALEHETARNKEEQAAKERAEANVKLSLLAFEEIFNTMAARDVTATLRQGGTGTGPSDEHSPDEGDLALLQSVLRFYDQFAARNATNPHLQKEAAKAHRRVGDIRQRLGQADQADAAYRRALAIYEKLGAEFPSDPAYQFELAQTLTRMASRSTKTADLTEAERRARRAARLLEELTGRYPEDADYAAALGRVHGALGRVHWRRGQKQAAETSFRKAVAAATLLVTRYGGDPAYGWDLATARYALAEYLVKEGRPDQARSLLQTSVSDLEAVLKRTNGYRGGYGLLAMHYRMLVDVYKQLGQPREAQEAFLKAQMIDRRWMLPRRE
jgi:tetratricopeptide (TPR) repeat protein/tRNA A-37 threonylcarbamoyl transferase component Bud32